MADRFRSTSKLFHTDGEWVKENAGKALVTSGAGKRIFMVKMDAVRLICFFSLVFATEIQVTSGSLEWKMYLSKVVEDFLRY